MPSVVVLASAMTSDTGSNATQARSSERAPASVRVLEFRGTDEELLQRLKSGQAGAASLLFDRFGPEVNGLVWRMLGADQEHDDIVQQVFCKLLVNAHRVRDAERFRGWVQRVTVNAVRSELRKRGVRRLFLRSQTWAPEPSADAPLDLESRDLLTRIYSELDRMPADERLAFSLRFIEEKPLAEVAELCRCSLATVKRRLQKANKRFSAFAERYPDILSRMQRAHNNGVDEFGTDQEEASNGYD